MPKEMSLLIKGALYNNPDGSNRMFEIAMLSPGDPIELVPEPKNPLDPNAVAIYSARKYQIGYVAAERAPYINRRLQGGCSIKAVFQERFADGGVIRVNFEGIPPTLPAASSTAHSGNVREDEFTDPDYGMFFPDEMPPED